MIPIVIGIAFAVLGLMLAMNIWILRKLRRIDLNAGWLREKIPAAQDQHFRQTEALLAMYSVLRPDFGFPPTRGWAGSPDFLRQVADLALECKPETVVECSSGASTLVIARALEINGVGHVYSLEHDTSYGEATRRLLSRHGLAHRATVIDAPLVNCATPRGDHRWYDLERLPNLPIDLLVIDGPPMDTGHLARYPAGPQLFPRLSANASVLLDDADRPDEREAVRTWLAAMPEFESISLPAEKGLTWIRRKR